MLVSAYSTTNRLVSAHFYVCECLLVSECSLHRGEGVGVCVIFVGASSIFKKGKRGFNKPPPHTKSSM